MDETKSVPKLRFAGFKDEWNSYYLEDVIKSFVNGQTPSRNVDSYWNGEIPWVSSGELNYNHITSTIEQITEEGKDKANLKLLPAGTFLMAITGLEAAGTRGSCAILDIEATTNQSCMALFPKEDKLTTKFLYYWYLKVGEHYGIKYTQGTKQQSYNKELLEKLPIIIPNNLKEQDKITDFLSLLNLKIELLEKKYESFVNFKKYLMQQIFAQKLRFDFDDELKNIPFKRILKEINEKTTVNNQHEILSSTKEGIFTQKEYFADRNVASKDNTGYKILRKNQIVLSPQNLWMGNINVNTEFDIGIVSPSYKIYETTDLVDINYFKHVIKLPRLIYEYTCASEQGASIVRRNLNKQLFNEITIKVPSSDEQKKIGNLLDACDEKIKNIDKNIQDMKEFKKGLLQQMFDNMPLLFKFNIIINK